MIAPMSRPQDRPFPVEARPLGVWRWREWGWSLTRPVEGEEEGGDWKWSLRGGGAFPYSFAARPQ